MARNGIDQVESVSEKQRWQDAREETALYKNKRGNKGGRRPAETTKGYPFPFPLLAFFQFLPLDAHVLSLKPSKSTFTYVYIYIYLFKGPSEEWEGKNAEQTNRAK